MQSNWTYDRQAYAEKTSTAEEEAETQEKRRQKTDLRGRERFQRCFNEKKKVFSVYSYLLEETKNMNSARTTANKHVELEVWDQSAISYQRIKYEIVGARHSSKKHTECGYSGRVFRFGSCIFLFGFFLNFWKQKHNRSRIPFSEFSVYRSFSFVLNKNKNLHHHHHSSHFQLKLCQFGYILQFWTKIRLAKTKTSVNTTLYSKINIINEIHARKSKRNCRMNWFECWDFWCKRNCMVLIYFQIICENIESAESEGDRPTCKSIFEIIPQQSVCVCVFFGPI